MPGVDDVRGRRERDKLTIAEVCADLTDPAQHRGGLVCQVVGPGGEVRGRLPARWLVKP